MRWKQIKYISHRLVTIMGIIMGIIMTIMALPHKNILTINLSILVWVMTNTLYNDIYYHQRPSLKRWFSTATKTAITTTVFLTIFYWLGGWGMFGIAVIILLMAAYRIYTGWHLYNYTTRWMAERLFKGSKEDFDAEEAFK